jgi:iron complex transport system substrate-binding protein
MSFGFKHIRLTQIVWFIPFASIALISLALLRPLPVLPVPQHSRNVIDAKGITIPIEEPFRGAAFTWGTGIGAVGFLEATKSPNEIIKAGTSKEKENVSEQIIGHIYPEILSKDSLWDLPAYDKGPNINIESAMAFNPGVYIISSNGPGEILRQVGLPTLDLLSKDNKNWDTYLFSAARVMSALIEHPERGEKLINHYQQAYADIDRELNTSTLTEHPRILIMGSSTQDRSHFYVKSINNDYEIYLPPAGVDNATKGWTGERVDAERILGMDPDYIFLMASSKNQSPEEFIHDRRWCGLKAVRDKRVYRMLDIHGGGLLGLVLQPISVRWMAEITHPDRMHTGTREMLRNTYIKEFGYRLSDEEIDAELHMDANKDSAGYERFCRNYTKNKTQEN